MSQKQRRKKPIHGTVTEHEIIQCFEKTYSDVILRLYYNALLYITSGPTSPGTLTQVLLGASNVYKYLLDTDHVYCDGILSPLLGPQQ